MCGRSYPKVEVLRRSGFGDREGANEAGEGKEDAT